LLTSISAQMKEVWNLTLSQILELVQEQVGTATASKGRRPKVRAMLITEVARLQISRAFYLQEVWVATNTSSGS
jgi:hypothetical protein